VFTQWAESLQKVARGMGGDLPLRVICRSQKGMGIIFSTSSPFSYFPLVKMHTMGTTLPSIPEVWRQALQWLLRKPHLAVRSFRKAQSMEPSVGRP
jgi:hypothetical protein